MGWASYAVAGANLLQGMLGARESAKGGRYAASSAMAGAYGNASDIRARGAHIAANAEVNAVNYDSLADYYLRAAGNFQMQGSDERGKRGLQLGQDKGRIMAEAAGSGIDASSKIVRKSIADTVKSAYHDYEMSAWNEWQNAYGAMQQRAAAKTNAANQRSIASWARGAYDSLAAGVEDAGALTAKYYLEGTRGSALSSLFGGLFGSLGVFAKAGGGAAVGAADQDTAPDNYMWAQINRDTSGRLTPKYDVLGGGGVVA